MTEAQLIALVLEAAGKTEKQLPRFRILGLVTEGLETLAKRVAGGESFRSLQQDFTATPTLGRLDLDSLSGLIFDARINEVRVSATNQGITMIDSVQTLQFGGLATDQVFCARDGNELVFRDATGAMNAYAQPVKIKANQLPSLSGLKAQYNGALAAIIAELSGSPARVELTGVSV